MKIIYLIIILTISKNIYTSHINNIFFSQKISKEYEKEKKERVLIENHNFKCNKELLISYGFEGNNKPESSINKYCPNVGFNCCHKKDMEISHKYFNTNKKKIERYYETYLYSLQYLLGFNSQIHNLAHKHQKSDKEECRTTSQNFLKSGMDNFESEIMYNIFGESLKEMSELRKGFYCIICDGSNHPFFTDLNSTNPFIKNSNILSKDFCKKLVNKTSKASFYLVNRLKRYLEELAILMKCSKDILSDKDFTFKIKNSENIELCYKSKDKEDFFSLGCQSYCQNFKLTQPNEILDGDIEQLKKYVFLIIENRKEIFEDNSNSLNDDLEFLEDMLKFNYKEVLVDKTFFNSKNKDEFLEKFNTIVTFGKGMDPFNSVENSNYGIVFIYNSFMMKFILSSFLLLLI